MIITPSLPDRISKVLQFTPEISQGWFNYF